MPRGRPRKGKDARSEKILVCIEANLRKQLEEQARNTRRTLSDYCHYVLEQHLAFIEGGKGDDSS